MKNDVFNHCKMCNRKGIYFDDNFFLVFSHELICTLLVIYSGLLSACILYRKLCKFSFIPAQDVYVSILQM